MHSSSSGVMTFPAAPMALRPACCRRLQHSPARGRFDRTYRAVRCSGSGQGPLPQVNKGLGILEWTGKLVPQGALVTGAKTCWRLSWQALMRELAPQSKDGSYQRPGYNFTGAIGEGPFPAEAGRYVVYVGNACPWCHRVLLALALRGLGGAVRIVRLAADPERASRGGWVLADADPVFGAADLRQVYDGLSPGFRGRCTAPLLVDSVAKRAVCNESSLILSSLAALRLPGCTAVNLRPAALAGRIDDWNDRIYEPINNGVYKAGFSTTQAAYDATQHDLYAALDAVERQLGATRFLCGDRFTEADLRLLPTIIRFDSVYATLFKCCRRRVADYPHLSAWMRDCWQVALPGGGMQVQETFDLDEARVSYFTSLFPLNPGGIVPPGPTADDLGLGVPAGRGGTRLEDVFHLSSSLAMK